MSRVPMLTLVVVIFSTALSAAREWTDASGLHTVEAEFVKLAGGTVHLRAVDRNIAIPLSGLSKADQEHIQNLLKPPEPASVAIHPFPGVKPASEKEIVAALAKLQKGLAHPSITLVLSTTLTSESLQQIEEIARTTTNQRGHVACVIVNDERMARLITPVLRQKGIKCLSDIGERRSSGEGGFSRVFVGFMNADKALVRPKEVLPADQAVERLLLETCRAGMGSYVFAGARPWTPKVGENGIDLRKRSLECGVPIWTPAVPKGKSLEDFVSAYHEDKVLTPGFRGLADLIDPFSSK